MIRLDDDFLRRLEPLRLAVRRRIRGPREGDRPTPRRGGAAEFHSHRAYAQGDDLRRIDWNVYARLGSLFVREHVRDEAPVVHLFLDTSASMGFGKLDFAARLAAALGAVAMGEFAQVRLQGERLHQTLPTLLGHLETLKAEGACRFAEQTLSLRGTGAILFFVSDFWDDDLRAPVLHARGHGETGVLHVLSPEESDPAFEGRIRFRDSESGETCVRFVGEEERARYRTLLAEHCSGWKRWATDHEMTYVRCTSDTPVEQAVLVALRESGIIT